MTSYTKKLFVRNPLAEAQVRNSLSFEYRTSYGRHNDLSEFTPKGFGKRNSPPSAQHACRERCGHPACKQGCVLFVNQSTEG